MHRSKKIENITENSTDKSESQKIYASMSHMSSNAKIPKRNYGDSSQMINLFFDSGATCHMTIYISDYIPVSLAERDKYIEVPDGDFATVKQTGQV